MVTIKSETENAVTVVTIKSEMIKGGVSICSFLILLLPFWFFKVLSSIICHM